MGVLTFKTLNYVKTESRNNKFLLKRNNGLLLNIIGHNSF